MQSRVVETDVEVKTDDGTCDAVLYHPAGEGVWPAILMWTDVVGLRPAFRDMGENLASQGYVVLVPNPFYRWSRAPVVPGATGLADPDVRAKLFALAKQFTIDGVQRDSEAFVAFLDTQPQTDKTKRAGVHGYCMGGQFAFRTVAAVPVRIGAVGSFHGTALVTDDARSPHRSIAGSEASYLVAIAQNDDKAQPEAKDVLVKTCSDAGRPSTVEVFPADHGWCVKGASMYNEAASAKAWSELSHFYARTLIEDSFPSG